MTGTIPPLSLPESLYSLILSNNWLEGKVPWNATLPQLVALDLSINFLSGTLPELPPSLKLLHRLDLSSNRFVRRGLA